ncbi:MAG: MFS transporter [Anaerolineae bacterium]
MTQEQVDYSRKWFAMIAVAMGIFLSTIDGSIVNVALPTLVRDLQTGFAVVQWVVLAYLLTITALMLSVGRLADMIGKKPLYTAGFVVFTTGSVLCGLAPTVAWLIGFRVVQAIGAAMVQALGMAIITEAFPPAERGRALGLMGSVVSVGIVVGPTLGGLIINALSWHWIFFVNLPVGLLGMWMVVKFVPSTRPPGGQRFDYLGAVALFLSLLTLLLGLTMGQQIGFGQWMVGLLLGSWLVFLLLFLAVERRIAQPMIDLQIFKRSLFSINLTTGFITFVSIAGVLILMPFYLENILGFNTRQVGLLMAAVPLMLGISSPLSGALSDRFGSRPITVAGLGIMVFGYYAISTLSRDTTAWGYILRMLPLGIGMGVFQSPNNSAIMGAVPKTRLGIASGLLALTRTLGQTTGIAVLGALWAGQVRLLTGHALSGDVTAAPAAAQVTALHTTFGGVIVLITLALGLSLWALARQYRSRRVAPVAPLSPPGP